MRVLVCWRRPLRSAIYTLSCAAVLTGTALGCAAKQIISQQGAAIGLLDRPEWTSRLARITRDGDLEVTGAAAIDDPSLARRQAAMDGAALAATVIRQAAQRAARDQGTAHDGSATTTNTEVVSLSVNVAMQELVPGDVYFDKVNRATYVLSRMPKRAYLKILNRYDAAIAEAALRETVRDSVRR
ncbi:MAG TPA: hypothetical protein VH277_05575 [Gemmatimonadaceae bacterium]|jgi:hypothetical protein|nr:hypothetical protein [Gemmatimonadaceae bacterium]